MKKLSTYNIFYLLVLENLSISFVTAFAWIIKRLNVCVFHNDIINCIKTKSYQE